MIQTRIVTELRQVEIEVRREELVLERSLVNDPADHPVPPGSDRVTNDDLVIVLSEEVPMITMGARAYELVRVRVQRVTEAAPGDRAGSPRAGRHQHQRRPQTMTAGRLSSIDAGG